MKNLVHLLGIFFDDGLREKKIRDGRISSRGYGTALLYRGSPAVQRTLFAGWRCGPGFVPED